MRIIFSKTELSLLITVSNIFSNKNKTIEDLVIESQAKPSAIVQLVVNNVTDTISLDVSESYIVAWYGVIVSYTKQISLVINAVVALKDMVEFLLKPMRVELEEVTKASESGELRITQIINM
jgi:hypothetical protein